MADDLAIPSELILAGIGIGVALVLLCLLSLYQTARKKGEGQERLRKLTESSTGFADAPPGTTPFFIGCFRGGNARFFRVYSGAGELLFLYAGQYYAMIDADSPRGSDQHWLLRSVKMLVAALAGGAVVAIVGVAAILRAVAGNAANNPEGAGHILLIVLGVIGLMALVVVILVPAVLWEITRRCRALDALPLSGLRAEAELNPKCFRAGRDSVADLKISRLDLSQQFFPSTELGCAISFKHVPTGRWKIETLTTRDTRDAIHAMLAVWGPDVVEIEQVLLDRLQITTGRAEKLPAKIISAPAPFAASSIRPGSTPEQTTDRASLKPKRGTYSVNGCGTMVCEARGEIDWGDRLEDCDSILAFCLIGIPIVPYEAVHTSNWQSVKTADSGLEFQSIPIRWTWDLVGWAYVRRLWFWVLFAGVICLIIAAIGDRALAEPGWLDQGYDRLLVAVAGLFIVFAAAGIRWAIGAADRRHRDIRLLLGRHPLGSSDPLFWTSANLQLVRKPEKLFGTRTFAEAVSPLLAAGDLVRAMFAARLAAALEDRRTGERLTSTILESPAAVMALEPIRREPSRRAEILAKPEWQATELFVG